MGKIKVHREKIHDNLGIYLDYSVTGVVKVLMIKFLHNVLDKFTEDLKGLLAKIVAGHLFQVRRKDEA